MPPCPGMTAALSLTPALRLSIDSNRSPAIPDATIPMPRSRRTPGSTHRKPPGARPDKHQRPEQEAADRPFDRLLRTDGRSQQPAPGKPSRVVLSRIAHHDRQHQQEKWLRPAASRMAITAPIDSAGYSDGKSAAETVTSAGNRLATRSSRRAPWPSRPPSGSLRSAARGC